MCLKSIGFPKVIRYKIPKIETHDNNALQVVVGPDEMFEREM